MLLKNHWRLFLLSFSFGLYFFSCKEHIQPKPPGYLRLEYSKPVYQLSEENLPFRFEKNQRAALIDKNQTERNPSSWGINLVYPKLKATVYMTYKSLKSKRDIARFTADAQKFTREHMKKADGITEQVYSDATRKVYGMFYEVEGNAASSTQFYLTDSTQHFLLGSLYFYTKPSYDSLLPTVNYLRKDLRHLIETLKWRE